MKIILIALLFISTGVSAQSFFKPLPKPGGTGKFGAQLSSTVQNSFRPVVSITAIESDGTQLAGGFGVGYQHNVFDPAAQVWNTEYSISAIGFLGTNGNTITGTAGVVVGFLNFMSIGGGRDFTNGKWVLLTGVQMHFN